MRAALATVGVAIALLAILSACAASQVVAARVDRSVDRTPTRLDTRAAGSHLLLRQDSDLWDGHVITRVLVDDSAVPSPRRTAPPGLASLPGAGRCVVSPALRHLLAEPGSDTLRQRYCQGRTSLIAAPGLLDPGELMAWVGTSSLQGRTGVVRADGFGADPVARIEAGHSLTGAVKATAAITALLLIPLSLLVTSCVRVSAQRRHRRLAAMRLSGASRRQATAILAGEVLLICLLGDVVGWALFASLMPLAARWPVGGYRFFTADAWPGPFGWAATVLLPAFGVWVARRAASRAVDSPYVERRSADRPPARLRRVLPLTAGVLGLVGLIIHQPAHAGGDQTLLLALLYLAVLLCLVGVPLALPALVRSWTGRAAGRSERLAVQLAATRLHRGQDDTTRAASSLALGMVALATAGLLLSVFDHSATDYLAKASATPAGRAVVIDHPTAAVTAADYTAIPGVRAAVALQLYQAAPAAPGTAPDFVSALVADCAELQAIWGRDLTSCPPSGQPARIDWPGTGTRVQPGQHVELSYATDPSPGAPRIQVTAPSAVLRLPEIAGAGAFNADLLIPPGTLVGAATAAPPPPELLVFTDGAATTESAVRSRVLAADPAAVIDSTSLQLAQSADNIAPYRAVTWAAAAAVALLLLSTLAITGYDAAVSRRRVTAALVVAGADTSTLRRAQLWYLAIPMIMVGALAAVSDVLLNSAFDRITTGHVGAHIGAVAVMAVVALCGIAVATPPAWAVTDRRPDPALLRTE
ncbi:FtsX-like permease family protein [Streptomyces sp. NBC_01190]|uniref:FtsX-like permease family protein n=1 Tax=Streptomyces sp. NBC_01190 TaxID=2903767 RepID=UPI003864E569|nr:hypothetical protein OG519_19725 [Streptomyces sp. NBC_01190]